jgi:hypothetical protein
MLIIPYVKAAYPVVAACTLEPERFVLGAEAAIQKTEWQDEEGRPVEKRVFTGTSFGATGKTASTGRRRTPLPCRTSLPGPSTRSGL